MIEMLVDPYCQLHTELGLPVKQNCKFFFSHACLADVRESSVLQESATSVGWHVNVDDMINGVGKEKLLQNTQEALDRGSFGVPRFVD